MLNVVLVEPEIAPNTGNVARTCAASGTRLHLVKPYGFEITDSRLKRAGLDYWRLLDITEYESLGDFLARNAGAELFFLSTKAPRCYTEVSYPDNAFLVFGPETRGLPESLLREQADRTLRIPMRAGARSLNLSNSVAVTLYEALRQRDFEDLRRAGALGMEINAPL